MLTTSHHVIHGNDILIVGIAVKCFDTNLSFSFRCVLNKNKNKKKSFQYGNIANSPIFFIEELYQY